MKSNVDQCPSQDPAEITWDNVLTEMFYSSGVNVFMLLNYLNFIFIWLKVHKVQDEHKVHKVRTSFVTMVTSRNTFQLLGLD